MSQLLPRDQFPPGLDRGDYVPLGFEEFRHGYDVFSAGIAGELPPDPTFPTICQDGGTGAATPMPDTPFNQAWYAAGTVFEDVAKRLSFYARVERVMDIALSPKYAKYVDQAGQHELAADVDRFFGRTRQGLADGDDAAVAHRDVEKAVEALGRVDDAAAPQDEVVGLGFHDIHGGSPGQKAASVGSRCGSVSASPMRRGTAFA